MFPSSPGVVHSLEAAPPTMTPMYAADTLRNSAYHLATCRPGMAPLANAALACVAGVSGVLEKQGGTVADVLHDVQQVGVCVCVGEIHKGFVC